MGKDDSDEGEMVQLNISNFQISVFLAQIAQAHPDIVTLKTIGKTHENREMYMVKISNPQTNSNVSKNAILIDGGTIYVTPINLTILDKHRLFYINVFTFICQVFTLANGSHLLSTLG